MLAVHWRWRKQEASRAQVREEAPSARFHPSSSLSGSPGKAQKECIVLFSGQLPKAETTNLLQLRNSRPPATGRALSLGERTPRQRRPQGSRIQRYDRQDGCRVPHTAVRFCPRSRYWSSTPHSPACCLPRAGSVHRTGSQHGPSGKSRSSLSSLFWMFCELKAES